MGNATKPSIALASLPALVDELGELKAEIADLKKRESDLKDALTASGEGKIEGEWYSVSISWSKRSVTAWKKIAEKLGASRQLITAYTTIGEESPTVRVFSRSSGVKKAA